MFLRRLTVAALAVVPALCLLGAGPQPASRPSALPKAERVRVEAQGAAYVQALNAADSAGFARAARELFAAATLIQVGEAKLAGQMANVRGRFGELEYHHSELIERETGEQARRSLHVYARSKSNARWQDLQFMLEPAAPYRFAQLVFIAEVAEPVYLPNGAITDAGTLEWFDGYIDKLVAENDLAGSMLVAKGDSILYERSYGFADAKRTRRVDSNTRFNLGSGNKMFTALAVAQLIEAGKLRLSDPIEPYFPEFPDTAFARRVTIGDLLSHTSGINDYWTDEFDKAKPVITEPAQLLPWVWKAGTGFGPGEKREYSNSNFALAGVIVEKASGTDYYRYVREHLYAPLGMRMSDSYRHDDASVPLAEALGRAEGGWRALPRAGRGSSAGGGYSTCRDMLKFARGLVAGRVVKRETLAWMTTSSPVKTREPGFDCGYGFLLNREGNVLSYGHGGITGGVNFELRYFPSEDVTFVTFNNQDNGAYDDLRKNVIRLVTGER